MSNILEVARQARAAMVAARKYVPDTVAIQNTMLYDPWDPNGREYVGKDKATEDNPASIVRGDDGYLYRCLTSHTSQADWAPGAAPSLWVRIGGGVAGVAAADQRGGCLPKGGQGDPQRGAVYLPD